MRRRATQIKPEILGEILHKILKKRNIPHASTDRHLLNIWRRAVGPQIAAQTYPDTLKRGSLFVRVSAPVWLHQLQFMKEEILCKINELYAKERSGIFSLPSESSPHFPRALPVKHLRYRPLAAACARPKHDA